MANHVESSVARKLGARGGGVVAGGRIVDLDQVTVGIERLREIEIAISISASSL